MRAPVALSLVMALLASPAAFGATSGPVLTPGGLTSVPRNGNARVEAVVTPSSTTSAVTSSRAYFRAGGSTGFYFVEMKKGEAGRYWAMLPIPSEGTKSVEYKIVAKDASGAESATGVVSVPVGAGGAALTSEESKTASNLVIGLTEPGQTGIPAGFRCDGIVNVIAFNGELRPNDDCRKAAAGSGGIPTAVWIAGGAAVAAGGVLIIDNNSGGGSNPPVSTSRPAAAPAPLK